MTLTTEDAKDLSYYNIKIGLIRKELIQIPISIKHLTTKREMFSELMHMGKHGTDYEKRIKRTDSEILYLYEKEKRLKEDLSFYKTLLTTLQEELR